MLWCATTMHNYFVNKMTHLVHILLRYRLNVQLGGNSWNYAGHDTFMFRSEIWRRNYIFLRIYVPIVSEFMNYPIGRLSRNVIYIWMSGVYYFICYSDAYLFYFRIETLFPFANYWCGFILDISSLTFQSMNDIQRRLLF